MSAIATMNHRQAYEALRPHVGVRSFLIQTDTWSHQDGDDEDVVNTFAICVITDGMNHCERFTDKTLEGAVAQCLAFLSGPGNGPLEAAGVATAELPTLSAESQECVC